MSQKDPSIKSSPAEPNSGSSHKLLTTYRLGKLNLRNRVIMSPMTRGRTENKTGVPLPVEAEYYAQRASAGLVFTGGIFISRQAIGSINVPALYTAEQVEGWKAVTAAVHARGGRIFAQLGHSGGVSHPDLHEGKDPVAPSPVNPLQKVFTPTGFKGTGTPRALTTAEIKQTVEDYRVAAENAKKAGFDGVEVHGANTYLIPEFLNEALNHRTDEYGGSPKGRTRFLFEVLEALATVWDKDQIGVKLSPTLHASGAFMATAQTLPTYNYAVEKLSDFGPAYLHLLRAINDVTGTPIAELQTRTLQHFRPLFKGTLIANGGFDQSAAEQAVRNGDADLVSFARLYISNPDLVDRFARGLKLAPSNPQTYYQGGANGYTDYPAHP